MLRITLVSSRLLHRRNQDIRCVCAAKLLFYADLLIIFIIINTVRNAAYQMMLLIFTSAPVNTVKFSVLLSILF